MKATPRTEELSHAASAFFKSPTEISFSTVFRPAFGACSSRYALVVPGRMPAEAGVVLRPTIEAEGREAVREIVASAAGVGFVSAAEFGQDSRLVKIPIDAPGLLMDEALICLTERSGGKLVRAFLDIARSAAADQ